MKRALSVLFLLFSANAWACSCIGISPIDEVIAKSPILVEAQVIGFEAIDSPNYGRQVYGAKLRVRNVLKGTVASEEITVQNLACYASLYPARMKLKRVYILPLPTSEDDRYELAGCAHSGMALVDGKLYTFEQSQGRHRRLKFYETYSVFLRNLSSGRKTRFAKPAP